MKMVVVARCLAIDPHIFSLLVSPLFFSSFQKTKEVFVSGIGRVTRLVHHSMEPLVTAASSLLFSITVSVLTATLLENTQVKKTLFLLLVPAWMPSGHRGHTRFTRDLVSSASLFERAESGVVSPPPFSSSHIAGRARPTVPVECRQNLPLYTKENRAW